MLLADRLTTSPLSVCNDENPCEGMSRHATFENFGMAFLTLFQVSTGDNWNGIMKVFMGRLRGTQAVSHLGCMVVLLIQTQDSCMPHCTQEESQGPP